MLLFQPLSFNMSLNPVLFFGQSSLLMQEGILNPFLLLFLNFIPPEDNNSLIFSRVL